ncbi:MAG: hypothetical protein JW722_08265 [Demequinaceae bacterium]|nr:hypothetical protein [Demequinaceae bacterium]
MRVDAFLADTAEVINNKIYALGMGWNTIYARGFPVVHRRLALALTVHVPFTDTNSTHKLEVRLVTEDGQEHPIGMRADAEGKPAVLTAMGGEFTLGRPPALVDGDEQLACFAFVVEAMRFEAAGKFEWVVTIDDVEATRLPMRVQTQRA